MLVRLILALALLCTPGCLLVNVGTRHAASIAIAAVGFLLLVMGIRYFFGQTEKNQREERPAWLRFLVAFGAAVLIFLA